MLLKKELYTFILYYFFSQLTVIAQTAISSASTSFSSVSGTSDNFTTIGSGTATYPSGTSYTINFRQGASNNLVLNNIVVGANTYYVDPENGNGTVTIQRKANTYFPVTNNREVLCYDLESTSSPTFNIKSQAFSNMKSVLESEIINVGIDNIFINDGETVINNVERVDKVYSTNLATSNITKYGFLILERNGNDQFKIAPITAVDGSNNPTAWGSIYTVTTATWGSIGQSLTSLDLKFDTDVVTTSYLGVTSSNTPDANFEPINSLTAQTIRGVFISYSDLGITNNAPIYGFSLFGADVNSSMPNIADLSSNTDYPINTGTGGSTTFGLDLINGMLMVHSTLVPVKISNFKASLLKEENVQISWNTLQEINNHKFIIEKSLDGINWLSIGEIKGANNSNEVLNYSFIDYQTRNTLITYYRLKQIDYDNKFEYSNVISFINKLSYLALNIYPNPTEKSIKFVLTENISNASIKIFDLNGVQVFENLNFTGTDSEIDLSTFKSGIYFIQIANDELFLKSEFVKN